MSPFSTNVTSLSEDSSTTSATAPTTRSTAASLRRHAILADLNVLQVATLMGTGLLVALGVVLGGRSYITTVSPDGLISSQPGAHVTGGGTSAEAADGSSPAAM